MLAFAVLALFGFSASSASRTHTQDRVGAWTVDYRRDRFADRLDCSLHTGRHERGAPATFEAGQLVFHLSDSEDTTQAVYRVDGGAPRSAAANFLNRPPRYGEIGTLESSTGGLVFIPATELSEPRRIEIRAGAKARVRRFDVEGLDPALAKARAQGCRL